VTPTNPCDWPNCPQGDPGWKYKKVKVTAVDRGELEDTIILDWAHTVLYPNLITGIFVGQTYYPQPQNPLNHTEKEPLCHKTGYRIKLAYNVKNDQGINLCYSTDLYIESHPKEYMVEDKEVPVKKVELSEDTYRVEWLKDMFHPQRYKQCLTGGDDGQQYLEPSQKIFLTKIPFCSQICLNYRFLIHKGNAPVVTKILKADCDKIQEEMDCFGNIKTESNGTGGSTGIFYVIFVILFLAMGVAAGFKFMNQHYGQEWRSWVTRGGAAQVGGPPRFQTEPVPPANVYTYRPGPDNLQSGPYIPCSQADSSIPPSDR